MTEQEKEVGHWFANHGLGWAVSEESREDAIEKLLLSINTPTDWHRNCQKGGSMITVYSCWVPLPKDSAYRIEWFVPKVDGVRDGANHMVTYLTQKKCAYMRDPSDLEGQRRREAEKELEDRIGQLRTLAYAITTEGSKHTPEMQKLLKECFDDEVLFPNGEEDAA